MRIGIGLAAAAAVAVPSVVVLDGGRGGSPSGGHAAFAAGTQGAGIPDHLAIESGAISTSQGGAEAPPIRIGVVDAAGNLVTTDDSTEVDLSLASPPAGAVLACGDPASLHLTVVAGEAVFSGCSINLAGTYTVQASVPEGSPEQPATPAPAQAIWVVATGTGSGSGRSTPGVVVTAQNPGTSPAGSGLGIDLLARTEPSGVANPSCRPKDKNLQCSGTLSLHVGGAGGFSVTGFQVHRVAVGDISCSDSCGDEAAASPTAGGSGSAQPEDAQVNGIAFVADPGSLDIAVGAEVQIHMTLVDNGTPTYGDQIDVIINRFIEPVKPLLYETGFLTIEQVQLQHLGDGAPDHLGISSLAISTKAGVADPLSIRVGILDAAGEVVAGDDTTQVELSLVASPGGAQLTCADPVTLQGTAAGGIVTFVGCSINRPGTYTLEASVPESSPDRPGTSAAVEATWVVAPVHRSPALRRIYGATADATAAAELESAFAGTCPGTTGDRPVVLATDQAFPDALASAYLAKELGTGTLLTPGGSLSSPTRAALQQEGITHVYIVGGPLAISTAVANALKVTPAYQCGTTTPTGSDLQVTRVAGVTATTTAAQVALVPGRSFVGTADLAGAYGGGGRDNVTAGTSSPAPSATGSLRTAIVASGRQFQDAEAGAVLSYAADLPVLLTTPQALPSATKLAIGSLGIQQVVLLGGQLAVSTLVLSDLEAQGVSVLRVAGQEFTGTAVELASLETASTAAHLGFGWGAGRVAGLAVARGDGFQDGLAGPVVAAHGLNGSGPVPLLLAKSPTVLGPALEAFVRQAGRQGIGSPPGRVAFLLVLGGPEALSPSVVQTMTGNL